MTEYKLVALTNAQPARDDEYNQWYDAQHLPDVLKVPGFVAAQRFKLSEAVAAPKPPSKYNYLTIYEIETDDIVEVMRDLGQRVGTERMPMSNALAPERYSYIFESVTGRVVRSDS
jgi:hypothetical protein